MIGNMLKPAKDLAETVTQRTVGAGLAIAERALAVTTTAIYGSDPYHSLAPPEPNFDGLMIKGIKLSASKAGELYHKED